MTITDKSGIELRECPVVAAFMAKVTKTPRCWNWAGARNKRGYGNFRSGSAHRISYEMFVGKIPADMTIDHICRNTSCVNPDHLRILSQYENNMCGDGPTALNSRKTFCINGHRLSGENIKVVIRSDGTRRKCRECDRAQKRVNYKKTALNKLEKKDD